MAVDSISCLLTSASCWHLQMLLCKSLHFGPLVQYHADGFIPNIRHQRAMGLAILDVAQSAQKHWKATRSSKNLAGAKKLIWREMFDVAVKWRRLKFLFSTNVSRDENKIPQGPQFITHPKPNTNFPRCINPPKT